MDDPQRPTYPVDEIYAGLQWRISTIRMQLVALHRRIASAKMRQLLASSPTTTTQWLTTPISFVPSLSSSLSFSFCSFLFSIFSFFFKFFPVSISFLFHRGRDLIFAESTIHPENSSNLGASVAEESKMAKGWTIDSAATIWSITDSDRNHVASILTDHWLNTNRHPYGDTEASDNLELPSYSIGSIAFH